MQTSTHEGSFVLRAQHDAYKDWVKFLASTALIYIDDKNTVIRKQLADLAAGHEGPPSDTPTSP